MWLTCHSGDDLDVPVAVENRERLRSATPAITRSGIGGGGTLLGQERLDDSEGSLIEVDLLEPIRSRPRGTSSSTPSASRHRLVTHVGAVARCQRVDGSASSLCCHYLFEGAVHGFRHGSGTEDVAHLLQQFVVDTTSRLVMTPGHLRGARMNPEGTFRDIRRWCDRSRWRTAGSLPSMSFAAEIAPEVDRLVLAVNTASRAAAKDTFLAICAEEGIDSPVYAGHYAEFLLAGRLTEELAVARLNYVDAADIVSALQTWADEAKTSATGDRLAAGPGLARLSDAILGARREAATRLWDGHGGEVDAANGIIASMLTALPGHFLLAVEHASLPAPPDPFQRLHQHLTTMRYVRAQCHAEAWRSRGMDRHQIVAMTAAWHQGALEGDELATRLAIEADTNECNAPEFDPVDEPTRSTLLEILRSLPGTPL